MKKERESRSSGDDLAIMSEIIKNDQWLLEKVLNKIREIRQSSQPGTLGKGKDDNKKADAKNK